MVSPGSRENTGSQRRRVGSRARGRGTPNASKSLGFLCRRPSATYVPRQLSVSKSQELRVPQMLLGSSKFLTEQSDVAWFESREYIDFPCLLTAQKESRKVEVKNQDWEVTSPGWWKQNCSVSSSFKTTTKKKPKRGKRDMWLSPADSSNNKMKTSHGNMVFAVTLAGHDFPF